MLIAVAGLVLDQVTKAMAVAWLDPMNPPRILGGLITSTLLDFFVRPALFWTFGRRAARRIIKRRHQEPDLRDIESEPAQAEDGRAQRRHVVDAS